MNEGLKAGLRRAKRLCEAEVSLDMGIYMIKLEIERVEASESLVHLGLLRKAEAEVERLKGQLKLWDAERMLKAEDDNKKLREAFEHAVRCAEAGHPIRELYNKALSQTETKEES